MVRTKLNCAAGSHPGLVRTNNEDRVYYDVERGIFLVIDGVGGQNAGEKAAAIAEMRIRRRLERQTGTSEERIREAITVANNEICEVARTNPEWHGMACVLTVALVDEEGGVTIGHVGDSRLYQIRRGLIDKRTHDHSPVGEREDAGELSELDAMSHPRRNEIYRDVGTEMHSPDDVGFIEIAHTTLDPESALLLCSDGLSDQVPSPVIQKTVAQHAGQPAEAVKELIEAANLAGGKDNVSVLIVEGERFAATAQLEPEKPSTPNVFTTRPAFFFFGFALAAVLAGAAMLVYMAWQRNAVAPVKVAQGQLLIVGPESAFHTIWEAMAKAVPGDTVEILGGEYREAIPLKDGVTVRSRIPRGVILRAAPNAGNELSYAVAAKHVMGARLSGFRILADEKIPLKNAIMLENSHVEIDDVEISGAGQGIVVVGGDPVLRANFIHHCGREGVVIGGNGAPWLSHNAILDNSRDEPRKPLPDLRASTGAKPVLVGNVFRAAASLELPPDFLLEPVTRLNFFLTPTPQPGGRKK